MDRTETHAEVGSGADVPEVKPGIARRSRPDPVRAMDRFERTLSAACGAICGVFAGPTEDPEAWLSSACGHILRLLAEVGEGEETGVGGGGGGGGVRGVWAGLLDGAGWRSETVPLIGAAGFLDQIEREDVQARAREQIREAASRGWAPRRMADGTVLVLDRPAWASEVGSLATSVPDGYGGEAVLFVGIVGAGGASGSDLPADRLGAATRAVWEGFVRAAGERIVRPRAGRRRLVAGLSGAQLQVLTLLIEGITEHEIASRLGRSRHTVHDHVRTIYKTLGMGSKTELITAWNDAGRR